MNQPRGSPNLTFWHAEWSPPGYHCSLLCSKRGPVVVSAMEGIPRSGCPVTHWGRQLRDFRGLFGKRCGTMRFLDHFGSILGILQWSSNILYSLEKPWQSHVLQGWFADFALLLCLWFVWFSGWGILLINRNWRIPMKDGCLSFEQR